MGCGSSKQITPIEKKEPKVKKDSIINESLFPNNNQKQKLNLDIQSMKSISISQRSIIVMKSPPKNQKKEYLDKGNDPIKILTPRKSIKTKENIIESAEKSDKEVQVEINLEEELIKKYGINDTESLKNTLKIITFQKLRSSGREDSIGIIDTSIQSNKVFSLHESKLKNIKQENEKKEFNTFGVGDDSLKPPFLGEMKKISEEISEQIQGSDTSSDDENDLSVSRVRVRVPLAFEKSMKVDQNETLKLDNYNQVGIKTDDLVHLERKKYAMMVNNDLKLNQKDMIVEKIQKLDISRIAEETPLFEKNKKDGKNKKLKTANFPFISVTKPPKEIKEDEKENEEDKSEDSSQKTLSNIIKTLKGSNNNKNNIKSNKTGKEDLKFETFESASDSGSYFTMKKFSVKGSKNNPKFSIKDRLINTNFKRSSTQGSKGFEKKPQEEERRGSKFMEYCNIAKSGFRVSTNSQRSLKKEILGVNRKCSTPTPSK